jgi:hypothetical protein
MQAAAAAVDKHHQGGAVVATAITTATTERYECVLWVPVALGRPACHLETQVELPENRRVLDEAENHQKRRFEAEASRGCMREQALEEVGGKFPAPERT